MGPTQRHGWRHGGFRRVRGAGEPRCAPDADRPGRVRRQRRSRRSAGLGQLSNRIRAVDENAIIVNAVQRHAAVVVQKSLVEGFGLTVTEAMWKSRPVLASAVGGILDQIVDGREGLLVPDPYDLPGFAQQLLLLLEDHTLAAALGERGHERVRDEFIGDRHLIQYVDLFAGLIAP